MALSDTTACTDTERRVADALISASKLRLSGDEFWLTMARAAIDNCDTVGARIADLEAALTKLLQATSDQVVMLPSQRDVWREAELILLNAASQS